MFYILCLRDFVAKIKLYRQPHLFYITIGIATIKMVSKRICTRQVREMHIGLSKNLCALCGFIISIGEYNVIF